MGRLKTAVRNMISHIFQFVIVLIGITLLTFSIMYLSPKTPRSFGLRGLTEMSV